MPNPIPILQEVKKLSPTQIRFRWSDGHEADYSPAHIRRNCHCAFCINELTGERLLDPQSIPDDLNVERISLVGRYALSFEFSDFHQSGIYPYSLLWEICPCGRHPFQKADSSLRSE